MRIRHDKDALPDTCQICPEQISADFVAEHGGVDPRNIMVLNNFTVTGRIWFIASGNIKNPQVCKKIFKLPYPFGAAVGKYGEIETFLF